MNEKLQEIQGN